MINYLHEYAGYEGRFQMHSSFEVKKHKEQID